jgi:hypothetical protein
MTTSVSLTLAQQVPLNVSGSSTSLRYSTRSRSVSPLVDPFLHGHRDLNTGQNELNGCLKLRNILIADATTVSLYQDAAGVYTATGKTTLN